MNKDEKILEDIGKYKYGFHDRDDQYAFKSQKGLSRAVVEQISHMKGEPQWMLEFRLKALEHFQKRPMPNWGPTLKDLNLDEIYYYVKPTEKQEKSWDDVPDDIKRTFDRLGVPEAERKFLAGLGAQYECLSGETVVPTARGPVPIRDILPGDVVFSLDEQTNAIIPAPVKNFMPKGERPVFEVKVGERRIRATENHPFLVLARERHAGPGDGRVGRTWKYLRDLKAGDRVAVAQTMPVAVAVMAGLSVGAADRPTAGSADFAPRELVHDSVGFLAIDSITPAGIAEVFDIEIDGPHNFVAEGLIVHNSEMVYHSIQEHLEKQGVIFLSIEDGLRQHPELFREYFGTVIPIEDNKFAALNSAVWSGGSFVYVPKGVKVDLPLQAYFRLNTANVGQFERTLIIVDEGASVHYVEGCTAPQYTTDSFHSGVIEIIVKKGARSRYSTIQNWSTNVYNLVTQRAKVFADGTHEWVDANLGSKVTMKYPSCYLMEPGAHGEMLSMAFAGPGQTQDAGGKMYHFAPNTSSKVTSKSISKAGGRASFRGLLKVYKGAKGVKSNTVCDALLLDPQSRSDTYPYIEIDEDDVTIGHEASVSKVGEEQLFYLMSRGLSEEEATTMVVSGFIEPLVKELPMEYAVEMNRLIQLQMEGSIG